MDMLTHKVTGGPELLVAGKAIDMRAQQFILTLDKEGSLPVGEDIVAVNPSTRLGSRLLIVRVCTIFERASRKQVWNTELTKSRRHDQILRRFEYAGCFGELGGEDGVKCYINHPLILFLYELLEALIVPKLLCLTRTSCSEDPIESVLQSRTSSPI